MPEGAIARMRPHALTVRGGRPDGLSRRPLARAVDGEEDASGEEEDPRSDGTRDKDAAQARVRCAVTAAEAVGARTLGGPLGRKLAHAVARAVARTRKGIARRTLEADVALTRGPARCAHALAARPAVALGEARADGHLAELAAPAGVANASHPPRKGGARAVGCGGRVGDTRPMESTHIARGSTGACDCAVGARVPTTALALLCAISAGA